MYRNVLPCVVAALFLCCTNQPKQLSGKVETLDVLYINWACDCADFIEQKWFDDEDYEVKDEDLFFIEPADDALKIPDSYFHTEHFNYYLRLTGQFYKDKGVPRSYEQKTEQAPDKARVFRYDSYELVAK